MDVFEVTFMPEITTVKDTPHSQFFYHNQTDKKKWDSLKRFSPLIIKFLLIAGLSYLSWLATYSGMLELIVASNGAVDQGYEIAIGFATGMLMLMIIYLLDNLFSPISWWLRICYIAGYIFLTIISVGFGFGFYWKFLESRAEATRSAISAVEQVETVLTKGRIRLEQLQATFDSLMTISAQKAELERTIGKTCPKSPPGDGPRMRLRNADARNFQFASEFVTRRAGFIKNDIHALNGHIAGIRSGAPGTIDPKTRTRNVFLQKINRKLNLTLTRFNAFRTDPQLIQFRDSFADRAKRIYFDNGKGGKFYCPDPQLQIALMGVVKAIDELPDLEKTQIAAVEGAEAIIEAFRRLTVSAFDLLSFPVVLFQPSELKEKHAVTMRQAGLSERDYIPLFIAVFVDLCILLISINRPVNRLQGFLNTARKAHDAQMHQVLRRFHEVHDSKRSARLDIFHDVMFDIGAHQYVAVPIDLRVRPETRESEQEYLDHKKRLTQARYLSTLMATLEEAGLVRKASFISSSRARRKLRRLHSPYADAPGFRVYRFGKGAWPAIILDDILGEAKTLEMEKRRLLPPPLPVKMLEASTTDSEDSVYETAKIFVQSPEQNHFDSLHDNELERIMRQDIETYLLDASQSGYEVDIRDTVKEDNVTESPSDENNFYHHMVFSEEGSSPIEVDKIAQHFAPKMKSDTDETKQ